MILSTSAAGQPVYDNKDDLSHMNHMSRCSQGKILQSFGTFAMGSKLPELCFQLLLSLSSNCSVRSIFKNYGFKKGKCHLQKNPRID